MNGGDVADGVPAGSGGAAVVVDCTYCAAGGLAVPGAMRFVVPTHFGEATVCLCVRHLSQMVGELTEAERQITGVARPKPPALTLVKR